MRLNRISTVTVSMMAMVLFVGLASISAQETDPASEDLVISPPPGVPQTGLPRESVQTGAVSSRAPGQVVREAIRRHNTYQETSLPYYATEGGDAPEDGERREFLIELLDAIFDAIFAIIAGLGAASPSGA